MDKLAVLVLVKVAYKGLYTSLKVVFVLYYLVFSLVTQNYSYTAVEECLLSQSVSKYIVLEYGFLKDSGVGLERNSYTVRTLGIFSLVTERTSYLSALKSLSISSSLVAVVKLYPLGKRVNNRRTNSVKTAGDLISSAAELSSCVKYGINDLRRRYSLLRA